MAFARECVRSGLGLGHVGINQRRAISRFDDKFSRRCRERELRLTLDVLGEYYGALSDIAGAEGIMVAFLFGRESDV